MKYLLTLSRILVGNLFIFSGIVKANDPLGFSYKLEEYFVEFGMNWEWLHNILVPLAALLCIVEILAGIAVLVGFRMKETSWLLLLMIVFFTILTGASAIFEIVRSCGCFGDAIPLTPWQSFYKDLILLFFIGIIFWKRNEIKPYENNTHLLGVYIVSSIIMTILGRMLDWSMVGEILILLWLAIIVKYVTQKPNIAANVAMVIGIFYCCYITYGAIYHLPFKDFRPYAKGKNLPEQMTLPEGAIEPVYENYLVYKNAKTGEEKTFTTAEYTASKIWEDKNWEWQSTDSELIIEGDAAKITDFSVSDQEGYDITDQVLAEEKALWIVCYDLGKASTKHIQEINELVKQAKQNGILVFGLSSAGTVQKNKFIADNNLDFDFYVTDGIVLKTMVRSNPGLMYLESGTVRGKWHENDIPLVKELNQQ